MNKKGFTLVELLAVVIIVSLLVIIAFPLITNSVNNYSKKTDKLTLSMIEEAAKLYIDDNKNDFPKDSQNTYCITIKKLVEKDYLKSPVKINAMEITNIKSLQVTYTNGYNIELVDSEICIEYRKICSAVTSENKTTGTIPEGNFEIGDEYICEVSPDVQYHFFVLSTSDDKINLILDRNINSDGTLATTARKKIDAIDGVYSLVEWISEEDYNIVNTDNTICSFGACSDEGPITAMKFLNEATKLWINIPNLSVTHTEEIYGTINFDGKARLETLSEISNSGCGPDMATCPLWMINYMGYNSNYSALDGYQNISEMNSYWILSSPGQNSARKVSNEGFWSNSSISSFFGVRPVITLPKNYLVQSN